jgi:hypothetical protein
MGYHPTLGRFAHRDPAEDGPNLYEYVSGMPLTLCDPTGLEAFPRRLHGSIAPPVPSAFDEATTPSVREKVEQLTSAGHQFWAIAPATEYGTIHFLSYLVRYPMQYGASMKMDFVPNEKTEKCCEAINIVQAVRMTVSGQLTNADWHVDPSGRHIEEGRAKGWMNNGRYIERSHAVNTPFMAGTPLPKDEGYGTLGAAGGGKNPLLWEDSPKGFFGTAGTASSGQQFETCIICNSGSYKGRIFGCILWGWTHTPNNPRAIQPVFNRSPTMGMHNAIRSWNRHAATQDWPQISVDWGQWTRQ